MSLRVAGRCRVEQFDRGERERRERLVQGEVALQVDGQHQGATVRAGRVETLDDAGVLEPLEQVGGMGAVRLLGLVGLVAVADEVVEMGGEVAGPGQQVDQGGVRDPESGDELLRGGGDQPVESRLLPGHLADRRLLALHPFEFQRVVAGFGDEPGVLDLVLGSLDDDVADAVVPGTACAAGDLVELAGARVAHLGAVVLGEAGEQHRADRHVDADAERVGAADDGEQAHLGEPLDQPPVLRQHAGVVHADAGPHQPGQRRAEPLAEPEAADHLCDAVLRLPGRQRRTEQRLGALQGGRLGEVDDVQRRLVRVDQVLDGVDDRGQRIGEHQRHRTFHALHHCGGPAGAAGEIVPEERDVAEGGRHQDELRLRQFDDRHLPRPAAVGVGVVVELVHHDLADVGLRPPRSAMLATISAVAQTIGASGLIDASPVTMPTLTAPKISQSAKNFSDTSALIGAV